MADGSTNNRSGSDPDIRGRGCFSHVLNELAANILRMCCLISGKFSSVGSHGRGGTDVGGRVLRGQEHWSPDAERTPLLLHCGSVGSGVVGAEEVAEATVALGGGQEPAVGKSAGIV